MNENSFRTIKEYFEQTKEFIIPNYQRGFKWGVPHGATNECSISILMDDLINAFKNNMPEYFLQGVTVTEDGEDKKKKVILVDGQQRTTTLYLLLSYLNHKLEDQEIKNLINNKLDYKIRQVSNDFLNNKLKDFIGKPEKLESTEDIQDIYYFKKAISTINSKLEEIDLKGFSNYLLNNVKIIYIKIPSERAVKSFRMLNGLKAVMTDVDLIKAKLLSKASREGTIDEKQDLEWEINSLRSRYAREWDKWLYWWGRNDVQSLFKNDKNNPLKLFLDVFYLKEKSEKDKIKYESIPKGQNKQFFKAFEGEFLNGKTTAKNTFLNLRKLQKKFEDYYNDYETYNALGLIFNAGKCDDKIDFLVAINSIEEKENINLWDYAKWSVAGVAFEEYKNEDEKENKASEVYEKLSGKYVYFEAKEEANKQLLRMNVELDNKLERKFNFKIYNNKSLEHIHAKSGADKLNFENKEELKKYEWEYFSENSKFSVHCIGNLVLLHKNDNSSLGAKEFEEKKKVVFNDQNIKISSSLLHTLNKFSKSNWTEKEIKENYYTTLINICDTYELKEKKGDLETQRKNLTFIPQNTEIK